MQGNDVKVSIAPLVKKLEPLFADGVQPSDFPKAAIICASEAETLGRILHLDGKQKLELVGEALKSAAGNSPEVQTFIQVGLPLLLQGAVLASKLNVSFKSSSWLCCK